jgi:tRNA G18 (ribose-2'-O)-methylase SpoU
LWLPYETVPPQGLAEYLAARRRDGYTIAAVEQTAGSVGLQTYKFPERVVLVLGSEGQGIPAPLLPCMDACLEIPQYGLVRSLNVAATGAIAVYEFTKQHRMGVE